MLRCMRPIQRTSNPRKQGDAGLGLAIGWFASAGYTVCVPLTDSQDYDLIIDDGTLKRVQVRTCTAEERSGIYSVGLRVKGGNRSGTGKTKHFDSTKVEAVFAVLGNGDMYFVPSSKITAKSVLSLGGKKYAGWKVE